MERQQGKIPNEMMNAVEPVETTVEQSIGASQLNAQELQNQPDQVLIRGIRLLNVDGTHKRRHSGPDGGL